jgi:phosphoacetylglucosamine mutase
VKLTEPLGEMLHFAWEGYATELANADTEQLEQKYSDIAAKEKLDASQKAKVIIARDTRSPAPVPRKVRRSWFRPVQKRKKPTCIADSLKQPDPPVRALFKH